MVKKNKEKDNTGLIDLNTERIKKTILEEIDPDCRDAASDFLDKYKNDTLTGY